MYHLVLSSHENSFDLGSACAWGSQSVICLWTVTDLFQLNYAVKCSFILRVRADAVVLLTVAFVRYAQNFDIKHAISRTEDLTSGDYWNVADAVIHLTGHTRFVRKVSLEIRDLTHCVKVNAVLVCPHRLFVSSV